MSLNYLLPVGLDDYNTQMSHILQSQQQQLKHLSDSILQEVLRNKDVEEFRIVLFGQEEFEDLQYEEEADLHLLRKIEQYNRLAKPNRSREKSKRNRRQNQNETQDGKPKRKVRTTITPAKLQEMNRIFKDYLELQQQKQKEEQGGIKDEEGDKVKQMESLKSIGQKLGLGYSTILHKFREFRATKKVKGGALIAALNQKRKYKKSKEIQELILKSLAQGTFYTAVELANYIKQTYGRTLSRSIISRHLGQMGYSYKNIRSKPSTPNSPHIKETRKKYCAALALLRSKFNCAVYFLDEYVFSLAELPRKFNSSNEYPTDELHLTILTSSKSVVKYELRTMPMFGDEFVQFLKESEQLLSEDSPKRGKVIVMDMQNPLHYCQEVLHLRKRMQLRDLRMFYLPPQSAQLSLLEWILPQIKESLMLQEYDSLEELKEGVQHQLKILCGSSLQPFWQESQTYLRKGMSCQNF